VTLRALIVDDEVVARRYLVELVRATRVIDPVAAVASVEEALEVFAQRLAIDVAFVDVRLIDRPGDSSGLELARRLARRADAPLIVLATALQEHALAAFDLGAVDYLLKPHTQGRVDQCAARIVARRAASGPPPLPRIVARNKQSLVFLPTSSVLAFEARDRLTYVHHRDGCDLVDASLAVLEDQLAGIVMRTHRNWLVAIEHVRELGQASGEVTTVLDGLVVPVSRERVARVREALLAGTVGTRRE
jgi:two-component system, LytTR family, response regulator LytT